LVTPVLLVSFGLEYVLNQEQSREFVKMAREIGADEEKSAADELLGRLAKMPPEPHKEPKRGAEVRPGRWQRSYCEHARHSAVL
jgi:hypothetical protein